MPTWGELKTFQWEDLPVFTWGQLKLQTAELLKKYEASEIPLTPDILEKLQRLIGELPIEHKVVTLRNVGDALIAIKAALDIGEKLGTSDVLNKLLSDVITALSSILN